ncbi:MAG: carbohydrate kinase family protein [Chloroflexi bacterium]|nr:carbohydrate kinase family protein [Chloroflexota bacterium]
MSKIQVIGLGAMNMDYLCQVERILEDGEAHIKNFVLSPGGSAANTIYALAKLGVSTGFIGAVGEDDNGDTLLGSLDLAEVDVSGIKTMSNAMTGFAFCLSDTWGRRSIYVMPGANDLLSLDITDTDYVNQAELLHVSSFADARQLDGIIQLIETLSPSVKFSFTPGALYAGIGLRALKPILERTDILFINRDEVPQLTHCQDIVAGAKQLLKRGCKTVVVTLGGGLELHTPRGKVIAASYILSADGEHFVQPRTPEKMKIADTTGAGDAFAAGFLHGWLQKKALLECGLIGDLVARFSMRKPGARQSLPTRQKLLSSYRQLYGQ